MEGTESVGPSACFSVQKIIGVSIGNGNARNYQVQWAPTWVSGFHLVGCEHLIEFFLQLQSKQDDMATTSVQDTADIQDELREDISRNDNVAELTSRKQFRGDIHVQASMVVNDEHFIENEKNNTFLYSNTSDDNGTVKVISAGPNVSNEQIFSLNTDKSNQINSNFEWVKIEDEHSKVEGDAISSSHMYVKDPRAEGDYTDGNVHGEGDRKIFTGFGSLEVKSKEMVLVEESKTDQTSLNSDCENKHTLIKQGKMVLVEESDTGQTSLNNDCENKHTLTKRGRPRTRKEVYKCIECNKCFSRKSNLNAHLLLHTGRKPFKCAECHKAFAMKDTLRKHLTTHSGEKPFRCTQCYKAFARNDTLKKHSKLYHECEKS